MKNFKRVFTAVATLLAVVVMAVTLAACADKAGSIKKAFEKQGYTITTVKAEDSAWLQSNLSEEQKKNINDYEVFTCSKQGEIFIDGKSATVIKFPSKDDIIEAIGQDKYDNAVDTGYVNGNCYLVLPLGLNPDVIVDIFKNA